MAATMTGNTIGDMVPDGYYTTADTAKKVGRSSDTLKRWRNDGTYMPTAFMAVGDLKVWLYDDDDILEMKWIAKHRPMGRPPKSNTTTTS